MLVRYRGIVHPIQTLLLMRSII